MFTKITLILLLHGYIAGENDNRNITGFKIKEEESLKVFSNGTEFSSVTRRSGHSRQGIVRGTYNSKIFRLLAPIDEDESNKFKAKGDLQPDSYEEGGPHVPMFLISSNNHNNGTVTLHEKWKPSEDNQADGTYNLPYYAHRPRHYIQYSPQYSNRNVNRYQYNDPCASYSFQHHNVQQSHFGQSSHFQNDLYLPQGTYNIHYYAQVPEQQALYSGHPQNYISLNTRRGAGHNMQPVNPCIPNHPISPSISGGQMNIYPYPNPPKPQHVQPYQPPNSFSYESLPPSYLQSYSPSGIYGNLHRPQQVHTFQGYHPEVNPSAFRAPQQIYPPSKLGVPIKYTAPNPPPKYTPPRPTPPIYTIPKYSTPKYTPPTPSKYSTPVWPPYTKTPPPITHYTSPPCHGRRCPPPPCYGSRCPSPTPPSPPVYTPSVWSPNTKSYTPVTHYTPCYGRGCNNTPPPCHGRRCPPPPCYGRRCPSPTPPSPPVYTPSVWSPNTKSYTPVTHYTPCYGRGCPNTPPPCHGRRCPGTPPPCHGRECPPPPNGYNTPPTRTKGYWNGRS